MNKKISKILKTEEEAERLIHSGEREAEKILDGARKEAVMNTEEMEKQLVLQRTAELKKAAEDAKKAKEHILSKAREDVAYLHQRFTANRDKAMKHITTSLLKEG